MLGLKLNHVSKRGHWLPQENTSNVRVVGFIGDGCILTLLWTSLILTWQCDRIYASISLSEVLIEHIYFHTETHDLDIVFTIYAQRKRYTFESRNEVSSYKFHKRPDGGKYVLVATWWLVLLLSFCWIGELRWSQCLLGHFKFDSLHRY